MAEPEERLGEGVGRNEKEEEGRLDNIEVKERRESEEGRIRVREEELRGRGGGLDSSQPPRGGLDFTSSQGGIEKRGGLDFTRGLISLKQMQEHSFSLVNQVESQLKFNLSFSELCGIIRNTCLWTGAIQI